MFMPVARVGLYSFISALLSVFAVTPSQLSAENKDDISIAAVGPLTGPAAARGKDLQQAVRMAVEEANAAGGVNGHRILLTVYDDADQPARARQLALQIATSTRAVAVLGQVASSAGIAAGQVYQQQAIPAITGAASQSSVTKGNEWFFRLLPDAVGQGRFLADYARYRFGAHEIAVIREKGTAGEEFASALRDRAKGEGIRIVADVEILPSEAADSSRLAEICKKLSPLRKGEIVILGTQYGETAEVLSALRDKFGPFLAMGYSSVATDALSAQFSSAENAHHVPGYYTEDLTVAAPQLPDIAEYAQTVFASRFRARYSAEPNPEAVRWYESAQLVFQAIAATGISGTGGAADRRLIRDWLAARNRPETAATGVGGPIYFDRDHNVVRAISVGMFFGGHLISSPVQFTPVSDPEQVPGWDRLRSNGMIIYAGDAKLVKTPVVYAGIEVNSLDNIDIRTSSFGADFFLWFRYQDDLNLDPHDVEFPTVISGGQLGHEISRRSRGGFSTVTYHVKGTFRAEYEFSRFPFDRQSLKIPVQIRNSTNYSMILAYGGVSAMRGKNSGASLSTNRLWRLNDQLFYRDVVAYQSSFGDQTGEGKRNGVEVNRINSETIIERDVFGYAVKNFLPLACILIAVLVGYGLAADVINPRVSIGVTALLTTSVLYQKMAGDLPNVTYITAIDYVFFSFFAFCVMFLALTVVTYETYKAKLAKPTRLLNQSGAAITLLVLTGTLVFVWVRYWGRA
jgi:ABC-type branched-subunit amino acid transport system substrate-binding protein